MHGLCRQHPVVWILDDLHWLPAIIGVLILVITELTGYTDIIAD